MAKTRTILCLIEPVHFGATNQNMGSAANITPVIQIQESGGRGDRSIVLHKAQRLEFQFGDRIICRRGVVTLTFNPDYDHLSHAVALGHVGHLKTEVEINAQTVQGRRMVSPDGLQNYTLAGYNQSKSGTNR